MKAQPLHDRLLVRRVVNGEMIVPDAAKKKPQEGEVLAVGKGKDPDNRATVALDVKVGDRILFGKYSGTDIRIGVEDLLILREDEFLVVLANRLPGTD